MRPGPTGFGLARFLTAAGIDCQVAAPSKLQRPVGDRVKTDCARCPAPGPVLLHLGEIMAVTVPVWSRKRRGIWSGPGRTCAAI